MFRNFVIASFAAMMAFAQGNDPIAENLFPPELIMQNQGAISLSAAEKKLLTYEMVRAQTQFTEKQVQLAEAMEAMVASLKEPRADEATVMRNLDRVLGFEREIKRAQITLLVRLKNLLTPDQQAQLQRLRGKSGGKQE